jgi:hypothetical protein
METGTECFECDAPAVFNHHVIPKAIGGKRTVSLCAECHGKIHGRTFTMHHGALIQQGMARAKARGVRFGHAHRLSPTQVSELRQQRQAGVLIKTLMSQYRVSKASVYRYLAQTTGVYPDTETAAAD